MYQPISIHLSTFISYLLLSLLLGVDTLVLRYPCTCVRNFTRSIKQFIDFFFLFPLSFSIPSSSLPSLYLFLLTNSSFTFFSLFTSPLIRLKFIYFQYILFTSCSPFTPSLLQLLPLYFFYYLLTSFTSSLLYLLSFYSFHLLST